MIENAQISYRLVIAYDGTDYNGWQYQPNEPSVVGTLKTAFKKVFKKDVYILGASRTDAGVHALGQVALIKTHLEIKPEVFKRAWNGGLPPSVLIRSLEVAPSFYPFAEVAEKTYYYHFFAERPLPFVARYGALWSRALSLDRLEEALAIFKGTHDFRSFCTGDEKKNTIRTITSLSVIYLKRYNTYRIIIKGPGFLRYMIRRIVGACLEYASHKEYSLSVLTDVLAQCDPCQHLLTAPAHGLMLRKILYKKTY